MLLVRVDGSPVLLGQVGLDVDHNQAPRGIAPTACLSHDNSSRCYWTGANADRPSGEKRASDSRRRLSARGTSGSAKYASSRESKGPPGEIDLANRRTRGPASYEPLFVERSATGSVLVLIRRVEGPFRVDRADRPRGGRDLSQLCRPGEQQPVADGQEHVVESFVFLDPAGEVEYASGRLVVGGGWEGGAVTE